MWGPPYIAYPSFLKNILPTLFFWLNIWSRQLCFILPQGIKFSEGLTRIVWFLLVLWFDIAHANIHKAYRGTNRLTHINIYEHRLLYLHSICLDYAVWITSWYKNLLLLSFMYFYLLFLLLLTFKFILLRSAKSLLFITDL